MRKIILGIICIGVIALSSCDDKSGIDYSTKEGATELQKYAVEKFGDKEIYDLSLLGENELSSNLMSMSVKYVEDGKSYKQSVNLGKLDDASLETSFAYDEAKDGKIKLSELDFGTIPTKFQEAIKFINSKTSDFENFKLYDFRLSINQDKKLEADFVINATKKGESTTMNGRFEETTYYGFDFELKADGTIEYKE